MMLASIRDGCVVVILFIFCYYSSVILMMMCIRQFDWPLTSALTFVCLRSCVPVFVCLVFVRLVAEQIICSNDRHEEARELPAER